MQSAKFHDVEHKDLDRKFRRLEALFHRFKQYEVRNMQPWKNDTFFAKNRKNIQMTVTLRTTSQTLDKSVPDMS